MSINTEMFPRYDTKLFTEIYDNAVDFVTDYKNSGLYDATTGGTPSVTHLNNSLSDANATLLFYLLYSKYGNNPIANYDVNQFKYKMWAIIFQYGPTWAKKLDIQNKLRELTDDEIRLGSKAIYNHAFNPSTDPSTGSLEELIAINEQNTTNFKKSKIEGYASLWNMITSDVTETFIKKFEKLFKQFVTPEKTWIYVTETDYEEEEDEA